MDKRVQVAKVKINKLRPQCRGEFKKAPAAADSRADTALIFLFTQLLCDRLDSRFTDD
jgi:hypothetical protein